MESRAILAALLMAALLIVYQMYFLGPGEPPKPPPKEPQAQAPTPAAPAVPTAPATPPPEDKPAPRSPRPPQRLATVESPRYTAVVSSEGGKLQEFNLRYRGDKPMVLVGALGPTGLALEMGGEREVVAMEFATERLALGPERPTADLILRGEDRGLRVIQTQRFDANSYAIGVGLRIENPGQTTRTVGVSLPWVARQNWQGESEKFLGQHPTEVLWQVNGHIQRIEDLTAVGQHTVNGQWIGLGSIWYLTALVPKTPGFQLHAIAEPSRKNGQGPPAKTMIATIATPTIAPGQAWEGQVLMYVGPKELDRLEALGLEGSINFGGFPVPRQWGGLPMEWLGMPILRLMNWVHDRLVPNYGVAIIILTLISKMRVGIGGPVGAGKTALMDQLCKRMRDRWSIAAIHKRHLYPRGRRVPDAQPGAAARADHRRRDWRLSAHGDPRGRLDQPRGGRRDGAEVPRPRRRV